MACDGTPPLAARGRRRSCPSPPAGAATVASRVEGEVLPQTHTAPRLAAARCVPGPSRPCRQHRRIIHAHTHAGRGWPRAQASRFLRSEAPAPGAQAERHEPKHSPGVPAFKAHALLARPATPGAVRVPRCAALRVAPTRSEHSSSATVALSTNLYALTARASGLRTTVNTK